MVRTICFSLILLAASSLFAQNCTTYAVVDAFDSKTTLGIDHLQPQDFVAKSGLVSLPVTSAKQHFNNRVLILVEISTRPERPELHTLARKIGDVVRDAPTGRPVAFGVFSEKAILTSGFFTEPAKRAPAIDDVLTQAAQLPGRFPAVFDSLDQALAVFGAHEPGDTIVLLGDGNDVKSKHSLRALTREFDEKGTRLHVVFQPRLTPAEEIEQQRKHIPIALDLKRLSTLTGGGFKYFSYSHDLEFAWAGYMLGILIPATWDHPRTWELKVQNSERKESDTLLFRPWKLEPCASTSAAR